MAAGALVRRPGPSGPEVLLVHRPKYDDWSFPKGKLDEGEHVLAAARREVREETGLDVVLGRPLTTQRYQVSGRDKAVSYWAARPTGGQFVPTHEVDRCEWLPFDAARRRLTRPRDAALVGELAAGPGETVPLVVLRHAKPVARDEWAGAADDRPLDGRGRATADALVPLLAAYGIERLVTSDTVRTVDTIAPYAAAHSLPLEAHPLLSEEGFRNAGSAAVTELRALLDAPVPTAICTHKALLLPVVRALCALCPAAAPSQPLAAGGFWVLHAADGTVVAVETHEA
nr:NUDIX hydrolase [Motilibacter aurantiacus]